MARTKQTSQKRGQKRPSGATFEDKKFKSDSTEESLARTKQTSLKQPPGSNLGKIKVKKSVSKDGSEEDSSSSETSSHKWMYIKRLNNNKCQEGSADDMKGLPKNAGKWMMFLNEEDTCSSIGMSHHERVWEIIKDLVRDIENEDIIAAKCSTVGSMDQGVICCYTPDHRDKKGVKSAASAIRKVYPYIPDMYYKIESDSTSASKRGTETLTKYKHTLNNELFEKQTGAGNSWNLVPLSVGRAVTNAETLPSRVTSHKWLYTRPPSDNPAPPGVEMTDYIEDMPSAAGKWLLFFDVNEACPRTGVSHLDAAWCEIKSLVLDFRASKIISVSCSTRQPRRYSGPSKGGVICCYTADHTNQADLKKAADAIRRVCPYDPPIYYKPEDGESEKYRGLQSRHVSIYMHSTDNKLFERDSENKGEWKLVNV